MENHITPQYRVLYAEEICRELFKNFVRHQIVTKAWRKENGKWIIKDVPFVDDWTEKDYQILLSCLKNTIISKGVPAVNAFLKDENAAKKVTALFFLSAGGDTRKGLDALMKKLPNLKTTASLLDKKQEGSRDNDAKIEEFTASVGKV